ncbi:hypothetical protein DAPPUDRAFT_265272 [Daphnia pulex]|uniref:Uncharacterized protein n=1 Tax=Daphnia pulex TaxID=6669 RepID=E9HT62_DAPPU|nr:hypothetical protein DAPPUDRAFT_265272 [Daphnia pulex]|eukprot:EFX65070.1 hypothetical protein DAPPUDRAFT_265272 [Daphnia pulex]
MREIQNFIAFNIQIRIVSEVAGYGSALAEPKTMSLFCRAIEKTKSTPTSQMIDVLSILYRQGDMLAYVVHCPGSFTSKVSNMAHHCIY